MVLEHLYLIGYISEKLAWITLKLEAASCNIFNRSHPVVLHQYSTLIIRQ